MLNDQVPSTQQALQIFSRVLYDFGQLKQKVQGKINFPTSLQAWLTINSLLPHKIIRK